MLDRLLPARRLASIAAMASLPPEPAELTLARQTAAKLTADLANANTHFETLNVSHGKLDVLAPDGSIITEVTDSVIVAALCRVNALKAEIETACRNLNALLRAYGDQASDHIAAGCNAVADAVLDRLAEVDEFIAVLAELKLAAQSSGIVVLQRSVHNVNALADHLRALRREIAR